MSEEISVARIRARLIWVSARRAFAKGAYRVKLRRPVIEQLCEINLDRDEEDPFGGIEAVLAELPLESEVDWDGAVLTLTAVSNVEVSNEEVTQVLEYWRTRTGRGVSTVFTVQRKNEVRSRLADGYTVGQLCKAVDRMMMSDFHSSNGYTDTKHVFRIDRLERWLRMQFEDASSAAAEYEAAATRTIQRRRKRA